MFKTILMAADGSEASLKAAGVAADLAAKYGSHVVLAHAFDLPPAVSYAANPGAYVLGMYDMWGAPSNFNPDLIDEFAANSHKAVERATAPVFEKAGVRVETIRIQGRAVNGIVDTARDIGADLIVMGSRGLGGFKSLLLGSVSDGVLHHAHCTVLIVR